MHNIQNSKGAALITSLVMLMALTVVSIAAMSSTTAQLQMAGNDHDTADAYGRAQSVVDAVLELPTAFVVQGDAGYTVCNSGVAGCDANSIIFSDALLTGSNVQAKVELLSANYVASRASGDSASKTTPVLFSVTGSYDDTGNDRGKAEAVQGLVVIIPKADQGS